MPSTVAWVLSGVSLLPFAAVGTIATFGTRGMHNACKLVNMPPFTDGTLTEAECGAILLSATKSAPRGKADATATLIYVMGSVILRVEGMCFAMIMTLAWYTLLFVKFEHRYPVHLAFAMFSACAILVDGNIAGIIPYGHDDGLLPTGSYGQTISAAMLPVVCLWCVMLPCHLFAFAASKGGDAKSKSA